MFCSHLCGSTDMEELNWDRKVEQTEAGRKIARLETQWGQLVTKNFEIERACEQLEQKIAAHNGTA